MTSSGVTQYSVSASAARSPARPWIHTAPAAAITGPAPWASNEAMSPVSTSPLPPLARPELPVVFTSTFPSGPAGTVRWPFRTKKQPCSRAKARAAPTGSPAGFPPMRANSPPWGVRMVTRPRRLSKLSICPSSAFMPSASSTTGFSVLSRISRTRTAVSRSRPRPGPMARTSQRLIVSMTEEKARQSLALRPRSSSPPPARGKGMAVTHLDASTCQMLSGTPRYTSPQPDRTAAEAVRYGAPV